MLFWKHILGHHYNPEATALHKYFKNQTIKIYKQMTIRLACHHGAQWNFEKLTIQHGSMKVHLCLMKKTAAGVAVH